MFLHRMNYQSHKNISSEQAFQRVFNKSFVVLSGTSGLYCITRDLSSASINSPKFRHHHQDKLK